MAGPLPVAPMAKTIVRKRAVSALMDAIAANRLDPNTRILEMADIPTPGLDLPVVLIRTGTEHKVSKAKQNANFETTVTLDVQARVVSTLLEDAVDKLDDLGARVEDALFRDFGFLHPLSEVSNVTTTFEISSDGDMHFGAMKMLIDCATFEAFQPQDQPQLTGINWRADTASPYDPGGVYPPPTAPKYTPTPAPRTIGPDGRVEGGLDIDLP